MKYSKGDIRRYDNAINHIRESLRDDTHDFWSALACSGMTFIDDIKRFAGYASQVGAVDITTVIFGQYPEWV